METNDEMDGEAERVSDNTDIKYSMLSFEKQIFVDVFDKDSLTVIAK